MVKKKQNNVRDGIYSTDRAESRIATIKDENEDDLGCYDITTSDGRSIA